MNECPLKKGIFQLAMFDYWRVDVPKQRILASSTLAMSSWVALLGMRRNSVDFGRLNRDHFDAFQGSFRNHFQPQESQVKS